MNGDTEQPLNKLSIEQLESMLSQAEQCPSTDINTILNIRSEIIYRKAEASKELLKRERKKRSFFGISAWV